MLCDCRYWSECSITFGSLKQKQFRLVYFNICEVSKHNVFFSIINLFPDRRITLCLSRWQQTVRGLLCSGSLTSMRMRRLCKYFRTVHISINIWLVKFGDNLQVAICFKTLKPIFFFVNQNRFIQFAYTSKQIEKPLKLNLS